MTKLISYIIVVLVLFLAVGAFILSYDALKDLALANGISPALAGLWPLLVDGAIVTFSLAVLRGSLMSERTLYPWALVVLFVALSVIFNVCQAQAGLLAQVIAAVPPVALTLAFELLMGQIKSEVTRSEAMRSLRQVAQEIKKRREALADLDQRERVMAGKVEAVKAELTDLRRERRQARRELPVSDTQKGQFTPGDTEALALARDIRQVQIDERRAQVAELMNAGGLTYAQIADQVGVSESTIKRDVQVIGSNGRSQEGS